jgi:CDP-2,3-bis-(O-geranylgeranyl)-sn-glycerol synthase
LLAAVNLTASLVVLVLLGIANGTPIFVKSLLKDRLAAPVDMGIALRDGQPLLGSSKTFRGLATSLAMTALAAEVAGIGWRAGAALAALAMLGDMGSSFVKRRLKLPPHSQAFGLDQLPECVLPLVLLRPQLGLGWLDVMLVTAAFFVLEVWLSRLLFRLHIRDRPY